MFHKSLHSHDTLCTSERTSPLTALHTGTQGNCNTPGMVVGGNDLTELGPNSYSVNVTFTVCVTLDSNVVRLPTFPHIVWSSVHTGALADFLIYSHSISFACRDLGCILLATRTKAKRARSFTSKMRPWLSVCVLLLSVSQPYGARRLCPAIPVSFFFSSLASAQCFHT